MRLHPKPGLVGGDFNAVPADAQQKRLSDEPEMSFEESEYGTYFAKSSYRDAVGESDRPGLHISNRYARRLDYLTYSYELGRNRACSNRYAVRPLSDHLPILGSFQPEAVSLMQHTEPFKALPIPWGVQ